MSDSLLAAMPVYAIWKDPYPYEVFDINSIETCFHGLIKEEDPNCKSPCTTELSDSAKHNAHFLLGMLSLTTMASPISRLIVHYLSGNLLCDEHSYKRNLLGYKYLTTMLEIMEENDDKDLFDEYDETWRGYWGGDDITKAGIRYFDKKTGKLLKRSHEEYVATMEGQHLYTCLINCEKVTRHAPKSDSKWNAAVLVDQITNKAEREAKKSGFTKKPKPRKPYPRKFYPRKPMPAPMPVPMPVAFTSVTIAPGAFTPETFTPGNPTPEAFSPGTLSPGAYNSFMPNTPMHSRSNSWSSGVWSINQPYPYHGANLVGLSSPTPFSTPSPPATMQTNSVHQSIFGRCRMCNGPFQDHDGCISSTIDMPPGFLDVTRPHAGGLVRCAGPRGCRELLHHSCAINYYWDRINHGACPPIRCPQCAQSWDAKIL